MHRRTFLLSGVAPLARAGSAWAQGGWRTFEVTTRVEIQGPTRPTRAWLPLAHAAGPAYQRVLKQTWRGSAHTLRAIRDARTGAGILLAEWPKPEVAREVELTLQVATRDRAVDWRDRTMRGAPAASLRPYLQPTRLIPVDGIVRDTARKITRGETDDVAKARAIYEWLVERTRPNLDVRGCGMGDIRGMLVPRNLQSSSSDINALFVGLARSVGIPARQLNGLRVAAGRTFKSLGRNGDVTGAHHCRAEFHSSRRGWVPVDPADVHKVALEEKPGLNLTSPEVQYARRRLFGGWEGNWIAFNDAHDLKLPNSAGPSLALFMYPIAEIGDARLDSLDALAFRYRITVRELA
jgi:transglutaminase-like putative cysteine protease